MDYVSCKFSLLDQWYKTKMVIISIISIEKVESVKLKGKEAGI